MSENSEETVTCDYSDENYGVFLGFWDQEQTPAIIYDLENSVNSIERKCKKLLQDLIYYQYYWEELSETNLSSKSGQNISRQYGSTSVPDLAFRRANLVNDNFEDRFHEKFQKKLTSINRALSETARKIGLKHENVFLFPTGKYIKELEDSAAGAVNKYKSKIKNEFVKNYIKGTAKSDLALSKNTIKEREISKITKNELEFYRKLSRMNVSSAKKKYKKSARPKAIVSARKNRNFRKIRRRNTNKIFRKVHEPSPISSKSVSRSDSSKNNISGKEESEKQIAAQKKTLKTRKGKMPWRRINLSPASALTLNNSDPFSGSLLKSVKSEPDIDTLCLNLVTALYQQNPLRENERQTEIKDKQKLKDLRSLAKKTIPFTACTSTSKSHNVGMNVQQYLYTKKGPSSLPVKNQSRPNVIKSEKPMMTPEKENEAVKSHAVNARYMITTYPRSPTEKVQNFSEKLGKGQGQIATHAKSEINCKTSGPGTEPGFRFVDANRIEEISKRPIGNGQRKYRSRYTKTRPESFIGYHKSTTKELTNGRNSLIKSESKTAYAIGSNIMVSDCRRTDFFAEKKEYNNASGDGFLNVDPDRLKAEWTKIFTMFSTLSRKYALLREEAAVKNIKPSDAVLKSLEREIDEAIEKYKEFLNFYTQFLIMKQRLRSMRFACDALPRCNDSSFIFSASYRNNKNESRKTTQSMALKQTLKKVRDLQDKIRLITEV